jgi:hypothetical protein
MAVLRGIGTVICSILLFLVLGIFMTAFVMNGTVLNPNFVNAAINKLDTSEIAQDVINEQLVNEIPQGSDLMYDVTAQLIKSEEPLIKAQVNNAINDAYDYLLSEKNEFTLTFSLTAIKQNLNDNVWQIAVDYLRSTMANMSEAQVDAYVQEIAVQIPEDVYPEVIAELPDNVRLRIVAQYLKELGGRGIFEEFSFGLDFLVENQVKNAVEQYIGEYVDQIPDSLVIDESNFNSETINSLKSARTYIGYFKAVYIWLIILIIVLAGLIFLINWKNIRASLRSLGIDILIFGILNLAGVLIAMNIRISPQNPVVADLPGAMQSWVQGLVRDVCMVALPLSIGILAIGIALTVASFFVNKPDTAA